MRTFRCSEFDINLEEVQGGVQVTQHNRTYLARKWQLTDEVLRVVHLAIANGLTCLWQDGHPSGADSHHISFSFSHSRNSWVFVIGTEAGPPALKRVTFHKRLKEYFVHSGLGSVWERETAAGQNIYLAPSDLASVLATLPLQDLRLGTLPTHKPERRGRGPIEYFRSEAEFEDEFYRALLSGGVDCCSVERQRSFVANNNVEASSRPDLIVVERERVIIIELKLHVAGDAEVAQVRRYLRNVHLLESFAGRRLHGVLVAAMFSGTGLHTQDNLSFMTYGQGNDGTLSIKPLAGSDVLSRYLG